jgi:acyl carrier protein
MTDVSTAVRAFVEENFLYRSDGGAIAADQSLLDAGLIDSTGILELVAFLEERFGIQMADADIVPENLDTLDSIAAYVRRKLGERAVAA